MEKHPDLSKNIVRKFLDENKIPRESMIDEMEDGMEKIFIKTGWASYNSGEIDDAIFISIKLQQYLKKKQREPNIEEKKFIDAIKEVVKKRNEA